MKALLDQGLPYSSAKHLRGLGWDVCHTVDIGMERAIDRDIIHYAREQGAFVSPWMLIFTALLH